jgi:predicted enzyme involved in methoxymalonyl-ACP biosynthesis
MIAVPSVASADAWEIDTFLMSCRVIGRRMEDYMMAVLLDAARERGVQRVVGRYVPTAKNGMVAKLYERLGFEAAPTLGEGAFVFDLAAKRFAAPDCFKTRES